MHKLKKYIEKVDEEIHELLDAECEGLTAVRESHLHLLLENRKHIVAWAEENGHSVKTRKETLKPAASTAYLNGVKAAD